MNSLQIGIELEKDKQMISNTIRYGTIHEVDANAVKARVKSGKLVTDYLPIWMPAAGGVKIWRLPSVGEQCMIFSPSGNITCGVIFPGIYQSAFPPPSSNPKETIIQFENGETIKHNSVSNTLTIIAENMNLRGDVSINGDVSMKGDFKLTGNMSATGDILATGKNSNHHTH